MKTADLTDANTRAAADRAQRRSDDFKLMVLCASKNNMSMYQLLRDKTLDTPLVVVLPPQGPESTYENR